MPPNATKRHEQLDARQLVVIDECSSNISLTPVYARAPKGERAYERAPRNRGKNTTLIAALTFEGVGESMNTLGSANAAAFERSIEEILAPSLRAGQTVIMDTLFGPYKQERRATDPKQRMSPALFAHVFARLLTVCARRFQSARIFCAEREHEREKPCRMPFARPS